MDSFTQIFLGAACGEAVLGRKIGHRAMAWGAVAGTIPDLDVVANFFTDEMGALAFHRSITHSLFFAVLFPFLLAWIVRALYHKGWYAHPLYKGAVTLTNLVILAGAILACCLLSVLVSGHTWNPALFLFAGLGIWVAFRLLRHYTFQAHPFTADVSYRDWYLLFFVATVTHPLLDCQTSFGTQFFQPFSNYRVALNNVSVVDPLYSLILLAGLIGASYGRAGSLLRIRWNRWGILLSTAYLALTLWNKERVDRIFAKSLQAQGIAYERFTAQPALFSNLLWQGIAEGKDAYYSGFYSLLEGTGQVHRFHTLPKNHELIAGHEEDRDIRILRWFSKEYYNILETGPQQWQWNDLRYGLMRDREPGREDYIFRFDLRLNDGKLHARQTREGAAPDHAMWMDLQNRTLGKY